MCVLPAQEYTRFNDQKRTKDIWNTFVNIGENQDVSKFEEKGVNIYLIANNDGNLSDNIEKEKNNTESS